MEDLNGAVNSCLNIFALVICTSLFNVSVRFRAFYRGSLCIVIVYVKNEYSSDFCIFSHSIYAADLKPAMCSLSKRTGLKRFCIFKK